MAACCRDCCCTLMVGTVVLLPDKKPFTPPLFTVVE